MIFEIYKQMLTPLLSHCFLIIRIFSKEVHFRMRRKPHADSTNKYTECAIFPCFWVTLLIRSEFAGLDKVVEGHSTKEECSKVGAQNFEAAALKWSIAYMRWKAARQDSAIATESWCPIGLPTLLKSSKSSDRTWSAKR